MPTEREERLDLEEFVTEVRVSLSVKIPGELDKEIRNFVELEGCRGIQEVIVYFLEVMAEVVGKQTRVRLRPRPSLESPFRGYFRAYVREELYKSLQEIGSHYGMKVPEITRVFLWMALDAHKRLVPEGEIVIKEELVEKIVASYSKEAA